MPVLRDVRIRVITYWSWEENECAVVLLEDQPALRGPLPPLASPSALYAAVLVDERTVVDWLHEPATWSPVEDLLGDLPEGALAEARRTFGLAPTAPREEVLRAAGASDVQVVQALGTHRGLFDGEALRRRERERLLENWKAFGRREARTFSVPHRVVLATHADPLEVQNADFTRSRVPELAAASAAAAAWGAARATRLCGHPARRSAVVLAFGEEAVRVLEQTHPNSLRGEGGDAPAWPPASLPPAPRVPAVVFDGPSANLFFSHAPGARPSAIHWFASCYVNAIKHPHRRRFAEAEGAVGAYAVHEEAGAVYVFSASGNEAAAGGGRTVSRAGLRFAAHPSVAEGGCRLFQLGSVTHVGLFCPKCDGTTWTRDTVRAVLLLLAPAGGVVHTNCENRSFITRYAT